ncbi:hypothetical protein SAMN05428642_1184 [Flaviramulus basaltis]|uniref:DUF4352 domain-containing protein n=1 Tax=Flaviramulus basaltis TaxID=369401 RepID=A0A1K2IS26_9FLAO|nr:hypothetical protein [Flaviramulus basaltis]SFZ95233.1 hypothetical protein SAMN05428642_1184 [Flaviramulus basaltis]
MKIIKIALFLLTIFTLSNCASSYKSINPKSINYISKSETENVKLEYKYNVLNKKYSKKELNQKISIVAIKITNNSEKDLLFGNNIKLIHENGNEISIMNTDKVFKSLKQNSATNLLYLLLTPLKFNVSATGSEPKSFPIGYVIGPGLAGGNMIISESANNKFKNEILEYKLNGTIIKKNETKYGLIGINSNSFESIKLKIE